MPPTPLRSTLAALCLVAFPGVAHAGDAALAESLFREGRKQLDAGNYASACPKLAESYRQDPAAGTLLSLSLCQELSGRTASAWAGFSESLSIARRENRADREQVAREHMQALEPKLSHVTIVVDARQASLPGLEIKRDGIAVGSASWGDPAPIDPGNHELEATAPGKRAWKTTFAVGQNGDSQTVTVPTLADLPVTGAGSAAAGDAGDVPRLGGVPLRTIGLVTGGVGIVGLGLSGIFALRASSLNSDSKKDGHCDASGCDETGLDKRNSAVSSATVATVALVAGGVLTAGGVTLFLLGGRKKDARADAATLHAVPILGPGVAEVALHGSF